MAWPLDDQDDELTLPQEVLDDPGPDHMFVFDVFPVDPDDPAWRDSANDSGLEIVDSDFDGEPDDAMEEDLQPTRLPDTAALRRHLGLPPDPSDVVGEPRGIRLVRRPHQNGDITVSTFRIETPEEAPGWLLEYQSAERQPDYQSADRWIFRTTARDREHFGELADTDGVELEFMDGAVVSWRELDDESYPQAAGEVFKEAHEDAAGDAVFVVEMRSCSMNLIKYHDGFLSWFDTGMIWLDDRCRVFDTAEEAFEHPDEMWFSPAEALVSVWSAFHSEEEIARRLRWIEPVDAHEFMINASPWRYTPGEGVRRVAEPAPCSTED